VHLDSDVAIKVNLEVSSLLKQITTPQGTIAYEIGTRNANTLLRLKDGETQILAGLIQDSDTRTANNIPGLGDIPVLGHLFGSKHTDREKNEIVLSITPRIVRLQPRPASEMLEFWYGSESRTRTAPSSSDSGAGPRQTAAPEQVVTPAQVPATPAGQPGAPAPVPPAGGPQPVNPSVPAGSVSAPLSGESPPEGGGPQGAAVATPSDTGTFIAARVTANTTAPAPQRLPISAPPATIASAEPDTSDNSASPASSGSAEIDKRAARSALSLNGPADARVGDEFEVAVQLSAQQGITRLRSQLRFDASALQLLSATAGDVVPTGANSPHVDMKSGGAQLDVVTTPDDPVQGTGSLMILHFKALAPRPSTNIAAMMSVLGGAGAAVGTSSAPALKVAIRP
jgi:general secretion pathway protein D